MKKMKFLLVAFLLSAGAFPLLSNAQDPIDPEKRLKELGIELIIPKEPSNIKLASRVGNIVYLSGNGPLLPNGEFMIGKVGEDVDLEQAKEAARLTAISLLAALKGEIGDLNKVKKVVKVLGMVNAVPSFKDHIQVINEFSKVMVDVFGPNGKHARSAVGLGSLPRNIPVEIEMIVELKE